MLTRATDAAEVGVAGPARSEIPDEGCKVREMSGRDLCGGCQMLEAICRKRPRRVIPEDLSDPNLLGAGEHGGRYRSRMPGTWPASPACLDSGKKSSALFPLSAGKRGSSAVPLR